MKKFLIFLLFLPLLGCSNIIKNKKTLVNFSCPRVFFSSEDRIFIDSSNSLDNVFIKAELNNFAIKKQCQQKDDIAIFSLDILLIIQPMDNLQNSEFNIPVYISLLDENDNVLETQYFLVSGSMNKNSETNAYFETDLTDRLEVITQYLETSQAIVGFMLDDKKRKLLN